MHSKPRAGMMKAGACERGFCTAVLGFVLRRIRPRLVKRLRDPAQLHPVGRNAQSREPGAGSFKKRQRGVGTPESEIQHGATSAPVQVCDTEREAHARGCLCRHDIYLPHQPGLSKARRVAGGRHGKTRAPTPAISVFSIIAVWRRRHWFLAAHVPVRDRK